MQRGWSKLVWFACVGLVMGVPSDAAPAEGLIAPPFDYVTREDGYQPPVDGDLTLYQTNGPMTGSSVQALAEGPDGRVHAGTFGDGVYTKGPRGDRWRPADQGPKDRYLMTLTALPDGVLLAGTARGGVFRSEDGGRRWISSSEGLGNSQVPAILRDPRSKRVYAGTGAGVFRSEDEGRHWVAANRGLEMVLSRSLLLGADGTLYTGTGGNGLFASRDRGERWAPVNEGLTDDGGLRENFIRVLIADHLGHVYAGSFGGGVFKSSDQGRRWIPVNEGLTNLSIRGLIAARGALYAGTGEGMFRTPDGGRRWESISDGMPDTNVQAILLAKDGTLYAGTGSGVVERPPNGIWRTSDRGMVFPAVHALLVDPVKGIFAGSRTHGLFRSKDGGETWVRFNEGMASRSVVGLARDAKGVQYVATPDTVYRADWGLSRWVADMQGLRGTIRGVVAGTDRLAVATSQGLFERPLGDAAWAPVAEARTTSSGIVSVADDPSGTLYAVAAGAVLRRPPDAAGWESIALNLPEPPIGVASGTDLYAWTDRSVFRAITRERTVRWETVSGGLPEGVTIASLAVDPRDDRDVVLAATSGGVWWTADAGVQWHPAQGRLPAVSFHTVRVVPPNAVVAASDEYGVFVGVNLTRHRSPDRP